MYHKTKSKSHRWSSWSDWGWDESRNSYYRVRQDVEGNYDYDWDTRSAGTTPASVSSHAQTPREPAIEDIEERFRGLSTEACEGQSAEDHAVKSKSAKPKGKENHQNYSHNKPAGPDTYGSPTEEALSESPSTPSEYVTSKYAPDSPDSPDSSSAQYYQESHSGESASQPATPEYRRNSMSQPNYTSNPIREKHQHEDPNGGIDDAEFQAALEESQDYTYGAYANAADPSSSAYARYDEDEDEGPPTPKAQVSPGDYVTGIDATLDELDPRYRVEQSSKFQPGEIFKVHWSEPQGSGNEGAPSVSGKQEIQNRFGTKFFVGFRRFIVIANDQGHCTCVPILTYGGKACKKKGIKAEKHGIIYERGHKARLLDREPKLGFAPVRVEMKEEGEKLSKESRVNYSKLVTVEHNIKVFFIGSVYLNDWDTVRDAVNYCWAKKSHHKQKHR